MVQAVVLGILAAIAFVPPLLFALFVRSRERHGREPLMPVLGLFVHGGTLGVVVALLGSYLLSSLLGGSDDPTRGYFVAAVVVAPVIEEASKAFGLGFVRRHLDEPEDGLVYGIAIGLGFAATETLLYGLQELTVGGVGSAVAIVAMRNVSSMLLHASSTGLVGAGYADLRLRGQPWIGVLPAYGLAVGLHALYNGLVLYAAWLGFVLAIALVVTVMSLLVRRIRVLDEANAGWLPFAPFGGPRRPG